ncbi:MAG TPA: hypothetical protein VFC29_16530 [Candidatus Limnocylindrales bacterium]|jgi:hypothetical protein|nr:hypothetical protein [Candidatus Limnocylindrales bacterium]
MRTLRIEGIVRISTLVVLLLAVVTASAQSFIAPSDSLPGGKSYEQWGAKWWQWADSIPYSQNPILDPDGRYCAIGQRGPVWFLAGTNGFDATRSCTIPANKLIFFPIVNYINDYPCPVPGFQPGPGQDLEQFLTIGYSSNIGVRQYVDHVTALSTTLDGQPVQNLILPPDNSPYRATSPFFFFRGDPSLQVLDPCLPQAWAAVADGYWVMLKPLSRGNHQLIFSQTQTWSGTASGFTVTYNLTIE